MKVLRFFFFILASSLVFASQERVESLPLDKQVIQGQLDNGLTYYIRKNQFPKDRACLQLVVKVGSLHEEEHERGLAHFVEHILFRGTEHFPDWELVTFLESIGAKFGAHTNAMTTFDHTNYLLDIPLDKTGALEKSILILSDFAARGKFEGDKIENERTVILDEINLRTKSASGRVMEDLIGHFMAGSKYPNRMPGGDREIIVNCDPDTIREFYKKWYRPDRMAVLAIGDFDPMVVKTAIEKCFGEIDKGEGELVEPETEIQPLKERSPFIAEYPELVQKQAGYIRFYNIDYEEISTMGTLRNSLISSLCRSIFKNRLQKLSMKNPPPYMSASIKNIEISNAICGKVQGFIYFEDKLLEGFKEFSEEVKRFQTFGPTESELTFVKQVMEQKFLTFQENLHRIPHTRFASEYFEHFMNKTPYLDLEIQNELSQVLLQTIRLEDVFDAAKTIHSKKYHPFVVSAKKDVINKEELIKEIDLIQAGEVTNSFQDVKEDLKVSLGEIGEILSKEVSEQSYETYKFDNGLKLIVHPMKLKKNDVQILLFAKGGITLFPEEMYDSLAIATVYAERSGFANLDGDRLLEVLESQGSALDISIQENLRTISAKGKSEHVETLFQLLRAVFLEKRFNLDVWERILLKFGELEKHMHNDPNFYFFKKVEEVIFSKHPFFAQRAIHKAEEAMAQEAARKAFMDIGEFTMLIVGDVDSAQISELTRKYLSFHPLEIPVWKCATLPLNTFPEESVELIIQKGKGGHCVNYLETSGSFEMSEKRKSFAVLSALTHILQNRLYEKMCLELGETYSVNCGYYFSLEPNLEDLRFRISFTCEKEKASALNQKVGEVIATFLQAGPTEEELLSVQEILSQDKKEGLQYHSEWLDLHFTRELFNIPHKYLVDYSTTIQQEVTKDAMQALAYELFDNKPMVKATLIPESE